ncbi:MAG: polysaccharide biosynthesis protein, partial [Oscillospiraceae bacterium]
HTYDSLWRYAEAKEYVFLLLGSGCGTVLYLLLSKLFFPRQLAGLFMVAVLATSLIIMIFMRLCYRIFRNYVQTKSKKSVPNCRRIAIIGAGDAGVSLVREIRRGNTLEPVMFLDDDPSHIGMKISGIPVCGPINDLPKLLEGTNVTDLVLAIPSCSPTRKKEILDLCTQTICRLRILPDRVSQ